jgi:asparagine synthase (glutamine-hydrolysing)
MISDVPLGAFLSGGVDSSLVVALMQKVASGPVRTFSIGFGVERYNEAPFAREVSKHLGTDHTELEVTPEMALEIVPSISKLCDEPFGDSSILPTFFVSQLARRHVTVALSGDGGDELFGGYDRYTLLARVADAASAIPRPVGKAAAFLGQHLPLGAAEKVQASLRRIGLFPFDLHNPAEKIRRTLSLLTAQTPHDLYLSAIKHWPDESGVVRGAGRPRLSVVPELGDLRAFMALLDTSMYLPDDILTKVDRASMACSLEARVPLLDHRLVEFAWRIPTAVKYRDGRGKWPLRSLVHRYLPAEVIDRPKKGFAVPLDDWLRGPLREWAWELLSPAAVDGTQVLESDAVQRAWTAHQSGKRNVSQLLWNVMMFQAWYRDAFR